MLVSVHLHQLWICVNSNDIFNLALMWRLYLHA